jgi:Holliday junction resolvase RusA-like endonuclease
MITFFVPGTNVPQGSKQGFFNPKTQRVVMRENAGMRHATRRHEVWMAALAAARENGLWDPNGGLTPDGGPTPWDGPIAVRLTFWAHRGVGHYGTGRNAREVKVSAPRFPTKPPDIDKLTRLVLDSLTSVLYVDDAQVVRLGVEKRWVDRFLESEGVTVQVREITE